MKMSLPLPPQHKKKKRRKSSPKRPPRIGLIDHLAGGMGRQKQKMFNKNMTFNKTSTALPIWVVYTYMCV